MASNSSFVEIAQSPSLTMGDSRLVWTYINDRWQHRLQQRRDDEWQDFLLADPEGDCVLQDLFLEQREDGSAEFQGMGQSAAGIHSASILCDPAAGTISLDLATRFRERTHVRSLRMTYSQVNSSSLTVPVLERLADTKEGTLSVLNSGMETRIEWSPSLDLTERAGRGGLTIQWSYQIRFVAKSGF